MYIVWNDGCDDNYFTGEINNFGHIWSGVKQSGKNYIDTDELGEDIECILNNNYNKISIVK